MRLVQPHQLFVEVEALFDFGESHARILPGVRRFFLAPDAGQRSLDFLLEAGDQFAVGGDQRLLCFDLCDDGLLGGEGREGDGQIVK